MVFHSYSSNCVEFFGLIFDYVEFEHHGTIMFEICQRRARSDDCSILGFVNVQYKFDEIGLGDLMILIS